MKAKKKPIEKLTPKDLGVDLTPVLETLKVAEPPARKGGQKVRLFVILVVPQLIDVRSLSSMAGCGRRRAV